MTGRLCHIGVQLLHIYGVDIGILLNIFPSIPKLDSQFTDESYITSGSEIARMDPYKTVNDNERKLASRTRPTTVSGNATKKTQSKVSQGTPPISAAL